MTFEIDLNPHSFVVFMTIAAGVSYIFFNLRTGFDVVKLMTLLLFIVPFAIIGNSLGHSVDLAVGGVIGFLTAKRLTLFNPFARIRDYFGLRRAINKLNDRLKENENFSSRYDKDQCAKDETARRQEQAKQERKSKKGRSSSNTDTGSKKSNQSQRKGSSSGSYHQSYQEPKPKPPSERDQALAVLGLAPNATIEEAKRARSKLMSLYHPDKLSGLPEGRREKAEEEAKAINVAWDTIKKNSW